MQVQREACGCYVARLGDIEQHDETAAGAIGRVFAIVNGEAPNPADIPF